jgi:hypothetical protein
MTQEEDNTVGYRSTSDAVGESGWDGDTASPHMGSSRASLEGVGSGHDQDNNAHSPSDSEAGNWRDSCSRPGAALEGVGCCRSTIWQSVDPSMINKPEPVTPVGVAAVARTEGSGGCSPVLMCSLNSSYAKNASGALWFGPFGTNNRGFDGQCHPTPSWTRKPPLPDEGRDG